MSNATEARQRGRLGIRYLRRLLAVLGDNRLTQLGSVIVGSFFLISVLGFFLISEGDYASLNVAAKLTPPGTEFIFGTDNYGRSILVRTLEGAKLSLTVSAAVIAISTGVGVPVGLISGYYRGIVDESIMRVMDVMFAFPPVILGLVVVATLGTGLWQVILALGIAFTPIMTRITRGSALEIREEEYVQAAIAYGERDINIMFREMLPNLLPVVIIQSTVVFAASIIAEAGLSFLGLSAQPPTPTWGNMISAGQSQLTSAPWVTLFPSLALFVTILGLTLLGVGLRDALDPNTDVKMEGL